MAKAIWKFGIEVVGQQSVDMPAGARILFCAVQHGDRVFLWAEVDPQAGKQPRRISIFGTGHPMPDEPGSYIGTFMVKVRAFVFHVYDAGSETTIPA